MSTKLQLDEKSTIAAQADRIKELESIIADFKKVTAILGTGIAHVVAPADFFALWNETEIAGSKVLADRKVTS